ncbi:MAG: hypothetical protein INR71_04040, partial [Terriglobus roseus]|nr:hypothetical protein [Terriglobus roseus]
MPPANFNPYGGHYDPYYYQQYPNQGPPQSPRPYPSPFNASANPMQPPFHPPDMSRSASQSSQRPPSSLGQAQTPQQQQATPQAPVPSQSANFVRPVKKSAIKITDAQGNEVNFAKSTPSPAPSSQGPVIVRTETPPQRVPSATHNRAESKPVNSKTAEETKVAFQEQVKRQLEEEKRRREAEDNAAKQADQTESEESQKPVEPVVKEAVAEAEKSAAAAAGDKPAEEAAKAAESAVAKDESGESKTEKEETEEERIEREIAEMEAAEREEEEREKAYQEKRQREKAEAAKRQAELDAKADEELKRQEREAEEREEARERERNAGTEKAETSDDAAKSMFAALKKPALGPGASAPTSGADTPTSEDAGADGSMPPPQSSASQSRGAAGAKAKPAHLKLETAKRVEPAEPTPGMQALKSARFLEIKEEAKYPEGIKSPNPALNSTGARKGRAYDRNFLLQFQNVFKEKPSVDWDQKVRETLGGGDDSARGGTRTPGGNMGPRTNSRGGQPAPGTFPMGSFNQPITRGMTSEQRFAISNANIRPGAGIGRVPSGLGLSGPGGISRNNSLTMPMGPGSRQASSRGKQGGSKRGPRKDEADLAAKMPLTAHMEIAPLQKSTSGWKPMSIAATPGAPSSIEPDGLMAPDLVQRKVKSALNKMTPEKFDKISDQILEIAGQSKHESDGRTLRQVIQLTFEKACDEAHWAGMYAKFCHKMLTSMSPEIRDETIKDKAGNPVVGGALFRKYLLNRCQEE